MLYDIHYAVYSVHTVCVVHIIWFKHRDECALSQYLYRGCDPFRTGPVTGDVCLFIASLIERVANYGRQSIALRPRCTAAQQSADSNMTMAVHSVAALFIHWRLI